MPPFNRKHQTEADEIGLEFYAIEGYHISVAPKILENKVRAGWKKNRNFEYSSSQSNPY